MTHSGSLSCAMVLLHAWFMPSLCAQNIAAFQSIEPTGQTQKLVLPPTHAFQVLAQFGDTLADGSTLRTAPDFTAFVPVNNKSDTGYLSLNHEISSLQGGVTVFNLGFDYSKQIWNVTNGLPVDLSAMVGSNRLCSGGITPWGTVISGEEYILNTDVDSNGYYDTGWLVETRPGDRQFLQKIWKAGNALHENCTVSSDERTLYWGGDDLNHGYVFKYIATKPRDLSEGQLFVLIRDDSTASTASWRKVPNDTPADCNHINDFCTLQGAWNFSGIEDIEISPGGGIYFTAKYAGRVWRFTDHGDSITDLEVFIDNKPYPIYTAYGTRWVQWGVGNDNLAFDDQGNLWVLQDGGDNNIWMVKPTHSPTNPQVFLFATTPAGCEPTGITFSPNKRYMFLSIQHPYQNTDTTTDVTGRKVVFDRGTTVVIARKEFLGEAYIKDCLKPGDSLNEKTFEMAIFPNPATNGADLKLLSSVFQEGKPVLLRVYDNEGRLCYALEKKAGGKQISFSIPANTNGLYRVEAICAGRIGFASMFIGG